MTGEDVKALQNLLNYHVGFPRPLLAPDGSFGRLTEARVKEFQTVNKLVVDGIVGPKTTAALTDVRTVTASTQIRPTPSRSPSFDLPPVPNLQLKLPPLLQPPAGPFKPPPAPQLKPPPTEFALTLQAGQQVSLNPWFISPLVITAQLDVVLKNGGPLAFTLSLGVQGSVNQVGSPAGNWSGQAFVQFGPNLEQGKFSRFSLLNPFVQLFIQKNQGQTSSVGLALGNQATWAIVRRKNDKGEDEDVLSLVLNGQVLNSIGLNNGQATGPPAGQVLLGVGHSF
jgi:peptidoglycan hydrolase-like protein with peptidoglycan-binding domain